MSCPVGSIVIFSPFNRSQAHSWVQLYHRIWRSYFCDGRCWSIFLPSWSDYIICQGEREGGMYDCYSMPFEYLTVVCMIVTICLFEYLSVVCMIVTVCLLSTWLWYVWLLQYAFWVLDCGMYDCHSMPFEYLSVVCMIVTVCLLSTWLWYVWLSQYAFWVLDCGMYDCHSMPFEYLSVVRMIVTVCLLSTW